MYIRGYKRRSSKRKSIFLVLVFISLTLLGTYIYFKKDSDGSPVKITTKNTKRVISQPTSTPIASKKPDIVLNINAIGDVALGQDMRLNYTNSFGYVFKKLNGDYNYFFSEVVDTFSEDDLTIANLETTLCTQTEKAQKFDVPSNNWWFIGDPAYVNILNKASIEAVCLANNHTYDYTKKGYDETCSVLKGAGVDYFGYSDMSIKKVKDIDVAMLGFNPLGNVEQGTVLADLKKDVEKMILDAKQKAQLVIVSFHWGDEYQYKVNSKQIDLGHFAIDKGADLVLGTHPHVLQPIEKYKDKYIAYSLGNFCFGGNKRPPDFDTCIFQQSFTFSSEGVLQKIADPQIIPCSISSKKDINDFKPTDDILEADKTRILGKVAQTSFLAEAEKQEMVDLEKLIDNINIDLRYASTNNITGQKVYTSTNAFLRKGTADKLYKASQLLNSKGYQIKIWDAYRSPASQKILWEKAPDKRYFANPKTGSNHSRGAAVDITLVKDGVEVDMPSGFDEMTQKASRKYLSATPQQKENALLLENTMKECGFLPLSTEWWHFDDSEYKNYDFTDMDSSIAG